MRTCAKAHVIRDAVTEDEIRSLAISQRLLGTREIILIHHTDCGMLTFTDDAFKKSIQDEVGVKPPWAAEAFNDVETDVRQSIARIKNSPFIPHTDSVRGFVFGVASGRISEVVDKTATGGHHRKFVGVARLRRYPVGTSNSRSRTFNSPAATGNSPSMGLVRG